MRGTLVLALVACTGCRQLLGIDEDVVFESESRVTLGRNHSCALRANGAVTCWGANVVAQLGNGTAPADGLVPSDNGVTAISLAAGEFHTCALLAGGGVSCWGDNAHGQLGTGDAAPRPLPTEILPSSDIVELVAGNEHTCGRLATGRVMCTGAAFAAGAAADRFAFELVAGIDDAVQLVGGSAFTCARRATDEVACWGLSMFGLLGRFMAPNSAVPVTLTINDAMTIAAGNNHACVLHRTKLVSCWGRNRDGNLGNDTLDDSAMPVGVSGITGAVEIDAGDFYACARVGPADIRCWGNNEAWQLGTITEDPVRSRVPVQVTGLRDIVQFSSGGLHSCAQTDAGKLLCWGGNTYGQLGDNTKTSRPTPTAVEQYP